MRFPHLLLFCTYSCLQVSAICFYPNGTADTVGKQAPCKSSGGMCCLLKKVPQENADTCTPDGLCIPSNNGALFRDTCTDKNWGPGCLNLCVDGLSIYHGVDISCNHR